jgi:hypothetical protein
MQTPKIVPLRSKVKFYTTCVRIDGEYEGELQYHNSEAEAKNFCIAYNKMTLGNHDSFAKVEGETSFWISDLIALMQAVPSCGALPAYTAMK